MARPSQDFVPQRAQEILAVLPHSVSAAEVLNLLSAEPWRERSDLVGAANVEGGSGGGLGSFLEIGGRFLKTSRARRFPSPQAALASDGETEQLRRALGIYHPERIWFLSSGRDGGFWACSLTPKLHILREEFKADASCPSPWDHYLRAVDICLGATESAGVILDCNPNNFGSQEDALFYVDDDLRCPPALLTQVLLRLREYPAVSDSLKVRFLQGFCRRILEAPPPALERLGLRQDLESRTFWPVSAPLADLLENLRKQLS
ncbi:MAG: hypothetical protein KDD47_06565 [Acidobacteria bacterium]|nr:hypothetical protein [Acidobacteriota bacterium]